MIKKLCLTILIITALLAGCSKEKAEPPAIAGNVAPNFTLRNLEGHEVSLSDFRGRVLLVNFWATWCPPCREEIPSMLRLKSEMAGKPFRMITISIDEGGKQAVRAYLTGAEASLPVLLDTDMNVSKRYGITGVPETFIIDRKGVIIKKIIGPLVWDDPAVVKFFEDALAQQAIRN